MKWISVKDRLPTDKIRVLTYNSDSEQIYIAYLETAGCKVNYSLHHEDDQWYSENCTFKALHGNVTDWMPLPDKPGEEKLPCILCGGDTESPKCQFTCKKWRI